MAHDLRPLGPLSMVDRAFVLARAAVPTVAVPAWTGGAMVAAIVLTTYYVERVEGIHTLRLPLAALLVLAWWARALLMGRAAREVTRTLWGARPAAEAGQPADVARTSMVAGFGLWVWCWVLVLGSLGGPVGVVIALPLLSLRGAFAPSWHARAACELGAGWRAMLRAMKDTHGRRGAGVFVEAMLLAGGLALAVNLYAALAVGLLLTRSFGGLEIASIELFLSPANTFVLLCVLATALVLLEPIRAALSALAYVYARVRAEGLDLRAAVEDAIAHSSRRPSSARDAAARAALIIAALASLAQPAIAQPPPAFPPPPFEGSERSDEPTDPPAARSGRRTDSGAAPSEPGSASTIFPAGALTDEDRAVQAEVDDILAEPEFREFADRRGEGLRDLIERLFAWLFRSREQLPRFEGPNLGPLPLPGPWFFLSLAAVLLVGVALYLLLSRRKEQGEVRASELAARDADPRDRPPASFLDDAAALAERGDLRAALRALYLATLVALDRRRVIAFDPHLTNWQYLRQMPRSEAREVFAQFTRLFDHKWYGREETTREDYDRCRVLASRIVEERS